MTYRPMLVSSGPLKADSDRYAFEVKWDGLIRRSAVLASLRAPSVGENQSLCYMIFDLLEIDGRSLLDLPYSERRRHLEDLELNGPYWCTPEIHIGEGAVLFAATKEMGLEGVVTKRLDSRYRPGIRTRAWTKTKHFQTRTFALLGWVPPEEWRQDRGCVVLGLRSEGGIALAGVVESGYGRDLVEQLPWLTRAQLRQLREPGRVWEGGDPFVGHVKYLEWSPAGGLRHATIVSSQL